MPITAGTRFGDCEILGPLGAGGMGEVYRARDQSLGREVAVKVLPEELASDPERLRRFEQEARAAAALNHPNILIVCRFGTTESGAPYLVTELLQGQTLRERLQQGAIAVRKTVDYGSQIARGLAAAHDRGIVHRDLKPENLFLTRDGLVKILDFGLAKLTRPDPEGGDSTVANFGSTEAGVVLGTVGYMSPEQVRGFAADGRSDIFSLGAICYEMISGKRAFEGHTAADTMSAILKEEPAELSSSVRNLPPALGRIVHRCLEKDPSERFQSARDLAFNLEMLSRDESGPAPAIPRDTVRRKLSPMILLIAIILAAAAGFFVARTVVRTEDRKPVALRRLTDFVGMEEFPALSPDGKSVAFTADLGGRRQVWVRLLSAGAPPAGNARRCRPSIATLVVGFQFFDLLFAVCGSERTRAGLGDSRARWHSAAHCQQLNSGRSEPSWQRDRLFAGESGANRTDCRRCRRLERSPRQPASRRLHLFQFALVS
jgi:hypothetical protein